MGGDAAPDDIGRLLDSEDSGHVVKDLTNVLLKIDESQSIEREEHSNGKLRNLFTGHKGRRLNSDLEVTYFSDLFSHLCTFPDLSGPSGRVLLGLVIPLLTACLAKLLTVGHGQVVLGRGLLIQFLISLSEEDPSLLEEHKRSLAFLSLIAINKDGPSLEEEEILRTFIE